MSKLNLTFNLFLITFLWSGVGYAAGVDSPTGADPSGWDLFSFLVAVVVTCGFGLRLWQALTAKDDT